MNSEDKNERIYAKKTKREELKSKGLFTCLWILFFLVIIMIFLIKREDIKSNLVSTHFFERVFGKTPTEISEKTEKTPQLDSENKTPKVAPSFERTQKGKGAKPSLIEIKPANSENTQKPENSPVAETGPAEPPVSRPVEETQISGAEEDYNPPKPEEEKNVRASATAISSSAKLCFVKIDSNGKVSRYSVTRTILKNDSPMTTSLNLLIEGPNSSEKAAGCQTLIPEGTKLLGATVKDGVAYLDFNERFMFNPLGMEGLLGQLSQIVYTATEFSTVDSVQFLIEGTKQNYLGLEGIWIGTPLTRESLK